MATTRSRSTRRRSTRALSGTLTDEVQAKWLNRGMWAAGGLLMIGGTYLLGKKAYQETIGEAREAKQISQTVVNGKPAFYAQQLQIAFNPSGNQTVSDWFGDGTDEQRVLQLLREIPDVETYQDTVKSYSILTGGRNLNTDLKDEMTSTWGNEDYQAALAILNSKKRRR